MKLHDVSVTISDDLITYPGDPTIHLARAESISKGDDANVSELRLGVHTGTHVDAPVHFIPGAEGIDKLDLRRLVGPVLVVDARGHKELSAAVLRDLDIPEGARRILFRTDNSALWKTGTFEPEYTAVTEDGAQWLVERNVELVGIDYLSIGPFKEGGPTHRELLKAKVAIVEGLNLSDIAAGRYTLACLPIKLKGSDGAPARCILIEDMDWTT